MFDSLQKNDEYVKAKNAAGSRKADTGPIGEVTDPVFNVMWYGGNDSVGAQLNEIVKQIQKAGKKLENDLAELKKRLKKAKINLTDE